MQVRRTPMLRVVRTLLMIWLTLIEATAADKISSLPSIKTTTTTSATTTLASAAINATNESSANITTARPQTTATSINGSFAVSAGAAEQTPPPDAWPYNYYDYFDYNYNYDDNNTNETTTTRATTTTAPDGRQSRYIGQYNL